MSKPQCNNIKISQQSKPEMQIEVILRRLYDRLNHTKIFIKFSKKHDKRFVHLRTVGVGKMHAKLLVVPYLLKN